jgi:LysM repeat protein
MHEQDDIRRLRYLFPAGLVVLLLALVVTIVTASGGSDSKSSASSGAAAKRKLPVYWTVKSGETYTTIADKTGLSVDQLIQFNPKTDPGGIVPGQRLKLRLHIPKPKPKPLGPRYWIVKPGESYGSIAAATHKSILKLQEYNPDLRPDNLQPGDRVRLRDEF